MTIQMIPLAEIDADAIPRDRTVIDPLALGELRSSIAAQGVRLPVELAPLSEPRPPHRYALISGYRRLMALRDLHAATKAERHAAIPALLRPAASLAEAIAAMVEENEIRADLSAWEKGRIAAEATRRGCFPTIEEAVAALYPAADKAKASRLRSVARLTQELDGWLTDPEGLSQNRAVRLAGACQKGLGYVLRAALEEAADETPETQWARMEPILREAERLPADYTARPQADPWTGIPTRPRRVATYRGTLTVRREQTREGWCLHFTGRDARSDFMDHVFERIDGMFTR